MTKFESRYITRAIDTMLISPTFWFKQEFLPKYMVFFALHLQKIIVFEINYPVSSVIIF